MRKAVDYAVEQMKKEGFMICPLTTRRVFGYVIDYMVDELTKNNVVEIIGLGTFKKTARKSRVMYSHLLKKDVVTKQGMSVKFQASKSFRQKLQKPENENK